MERQRSKPPVIAFGIHPVKEALEAGKSVEKIFIRKNGDRGVYLEIMRLAKTLNVPIQIVPVEKIDRFTSKVHQGIVAIISPFSFQIIDDVLPHIYEQGLVPLLVVCCGVTDVHNIGAIARTCVGTGVQAMILPHKGSAALNSEALKASAGMLSKLTLCRAESLSKLLDYLNLNGINTIAIDAVGSSYSYQVDYKVPTAIFIGDEGEGVPDFILRHTNSIVRLPMDTALESYNVSVATGMVLYEAMRQREMLPST